MSAKEHGPDAPTRLAENIRTGDRFRTLVYHIDESDTFLIIDYGAKPEPYDFVFVAQEDANDITLAIYDGQPYIGVARVLEFYQLTQSEQWAPKYKIFGLQLVGLVSSILGMTTLLVA